MIIWKKKKLIFYFIILYLNFLFRIILIIISFVKFQVIQENNSLFDIIIALNESIDIIYIFTKFHHNIDEITDSNYFNYK